ncbi:CDP-diacylglycerol diphosphatase [Geotalea sp. SG265]|uniref:CDP-diacylglycerol diphosphatase n=1 Tax=Geotalea sp. SG265 TaxID=2922867 RepID=UPI001FAFBA3A|nr:CDP-diacylglycerol diphosphatase [Geotalea sp. SG265]
MQIHPIPTGRKYLMAALLPAVLFLSAVPCLSADRNILWNTISTCIDTSDKDYCSKCSTPRVEVDCNTCRNLTEVWAESKEFAAIRDRKMCDCPPGFVHGLVIPRSRVTGVEDPLRPDGIWQFAWDSAVKKLPEGEIALVVNPKKDRSQDQLHVHIVRVRRETLPSDPARMSLVHSLDRVWYEAARKAAELEWKDYGVLVTRKAGEGYLVVVDEGSPEDRFTLARCR